MEESRDLISFLPVPILHHILSCLPIKDAARTSVLSKQWNLVRKSFPFLGFWLPADMEDMPGDAPQFKERLGVFLDFVDRSLQHFARNKLSMKRLCLVVSHIDSDSVPLVNPWLPLALHRGVSEIVFEVCVDLERDDKSNYPLPETTFAINSSLLRDSFEFFRLEKLWLAKVCLSEGIVRDIIRNCPNIRSLLLLDILGLTTLKISKPNRLRCLTVTIASSCYISRDISINVDALSLKYFSFSFPYDNIPCAIDLTSCINLRVIKLCNNLITDAQFNMHISKFPLLEFLEIRCCHRLRAIRAPLHRLKHLHLHCCAEIRAVEIDSPILSSFNFRPYGHDFPFEFSSKVFPCPVNLLFELNVSRDQISSWFLELREFPDDDFKGIHFYPRSDGIKLCFDNDKSGEALTSTLIEVECLDLTDLSIIAPFEWVTLLDGLLSSCHPKIVCISADSRDEDNCLDFLCQMLEQRESHLCSNLPHSKDWRHHLKAAKIESINDVKSDIEIVEETENTQSLRVWHTFLSIPKDCEENCRVRFKLDWDMSAIRGICDHLHSLESFAIR